MPRMALGTREMIEALQVRFDGKTTRLFIAAQRRVELTSDEMAVYVHKMLTNPEKFLVLATVEEELEDKVSFMVIINTPEDAKQVGTRVGKQLCQDWVQTVAVHYEQLDSEEAKDIWRQTIAMARESWLIHNN